MLPRFRTAAFVFALAATAGLAAFAGTRDEAGTMTSFAGSRAPEFAGIERWHNSAPLTLDRLRGKVVLVDFWTYSCINCIHTIPYVNDWYRKYRDQGLVVVGVHTPEYPFEREAKTLPTRSRASASAIRSRRTTVTTRGARTATSTGPRCI